MLAAEGVTLSWLVVWLRVVCECVGPPVACLCLVLIPTVHGSGTSWGWLRALCCMHHASFSAFLLETALLWELSAVGTACVAAVTPIRSVPSHPSCSFENQPAASMFFRGVVCEGLLMPDLHCMVAATRWWCALCQLAAFSLHARHQPRQRLRLPLINLVRTAYSFLDCVCDQVLCTHITYTYHMRADCAEPTHTYPQGAAVAAVNQSRARLLACSCSCTTGR